MSSFLNFPTFKNILEASKYLKNKINKTPILTSKILDNKLNCQVYLKCENFQKTGAFKFRGSFFALSKLNQEQKNSGILTFSSGNHAQATALTSKILGIKANILMPKDAPKIKIEATKNYGANVIFYDRYKENREEIAKNLQEKNNWTFISSYDNFDVISGAGTCAFELFSEIKDLDILITPIGGGGLLAGSCLLAKHFNKNCEIFGVEPKLGNDAFLSLKSGKIIKIKSPKTIADGASTPHLGKLTFPIIQKNVKEILLCEDEELIETFKFLLNYLKILVEPTGCLGLAGLIQNKARFKNKKVGIILSGGNVDLDKLKEF